MPLADAREEVASVCTFKATGGGRTQDITLTTGTFAVTGTWSNLAYKGKGGCPVGRSIVS
jgi:hypothetical protein